ncbi:mechanosensitive ion channel family protein [Thalassotalea castellviae]|uniref:Small-conductance mechanosensitive channel n=1 Tax=Thalassotalea castellviae TaxID=3075612 RepID=A0ABU3A4I8_9GAMM|nr:mechanosensitive ion channel family protein [Thalassotalea sp. W431]MDT0605096.1 mechanosensitive ion channel family protein [Thalassotalea sp. W431]
MNLNVLDNFSGLIEEKLDTWLQELIMHIPNVVVAFLIVFIFSIMARFFGKVIGNILRKGLDSKQIADLLTSIGKVSILIAGIFISLDFIGLKGTVTSLLAGAGIVGLAIGFAFQDMTENLIAGIAMGIRKPFQVGDVIRADSVFGTVKTINLRNTLVETFFGQLEIVPNKILFRNILTNFSVNRIRCIEIPVGISYADDPEEAAKVIVEQLNQCDFVIKKDETAVYAEGFGDSSINLLVWFWIDYPGETGFMQARHQAVAAINDALKSANILIPFPIRTLDFAIKGGEKLNAMLNKQSDDNQNEIN